MLKSVRRTVCPSGAARATSPAPTLPAAPGLFSTSTGLPSAAPRRSDSRRPIRSSGPPGGNGLTMRTGLEGYCAAALSAVLSSRARMRRAMRLILTQDLPGCLGLVRRDGALQLGVLRAGKEAQLV